ncbi:MAG: hypothetical protein MHM6MM_006166 [Cercozoa sp. M6MM]
MRILLTVALGLSACALARQDACALSDVFERYDCGHVGITEQECVQRNCCWVPSSKHGEAWCFKKQGATQYVDVGETDSPEWAVSSHKWQLRKGAAQFGDDFAEARVSVGYYGDGDRSDVVRVEITNAEHERFTVPSNAQPSPDALTYSPLKQVPSQRALNVKVENDQDMGAFVTVARNNREATTLLDTRNEFGVTLQEQYLQATLTLPGDNDFAFYGLGERVLPFRLPDGRDGPHTFAMWTADVLTPDDQNVYGHHPFAVFVAADGTASGLLLRNVNAQEVEIVRQKEENRRLLQWRTTFLALCTQSQCARQCASVASARRTGSMRYRLLHHWSTLFFKAHTQGGQVLYPLSFLWPNEQHFRGTDDAFVLGEHLLVAPVLDEGARTVWAPLPAGTGRL